MSKSDKPKLTSVFLNGIITAVAAGDGDVFCGGGTGKMDDGTSGDLS